MNDKIIFLTDSFYEQDFELLLFYCLRLKLSGNKPIENWIYPLLLWIHFSAQFSISDKTGCSAFPFSDKEYSIRTGVSG